MYAVGHVSALVVMLIERAAACLQTSAQLWTAELGIATFTLFEARRETGRARCEKCEHGASVPRRYARLRLERRSQAGFGLWCGRPRPQDIAESGTDTDAGWAIYSNPCNAYSPGSLPYWPAPPWP
jgi:hypothetical protein